METDIRGIEPGKRLSARKARTAPLVAAFGEWLQEQRLRVSACWISASPFSRYPDLAIDANSGARQIDREQFGVDISA